MDKFNGIPPGGKILDFKKPPVSVSVQKPEDVWAFPLDALKQLVSDIEHGIVSPDMVYIAMRTPHPTEKDAYGFPRYMWGPPSPGASLLFSGLLHKHLQRL